MKSQRWTATDHVTTSFTPPFSPLREEFVPPNLAANVKLEALGIMPQAELSHIQRDQNWYHAQLPQVILFNIMAT
jgi:hypothetical protein